jgi:hypothetical protein
MSEANHQAAKPSLDQGPPRRTRYCAGCGLLMDVTYLLPRRKYRCDECGASFRHLPGYEGKRPSPFGTALRLAAATIGTGAMVIAVAYFGRLEATLPVFAGAIGGAAALFLVGCLLLRMRSRSSSGLAAAMLIAAALGVLTLLMLGSGRDEKVATPEMAMFVWL